MISDFFLGAFIQIIGFITRPLQSQPDVSLPTQFTTTLTAQVGNVKAVGSVLPFASGTLLTFFALLVFTEFVLFVYKVIMWGIKRVPTQS